MWKGKPWSAVAVISVAMLTASCDQQDHDATAIEKMSVVFLGGHSADEVRRVAGETLRKFGESEDEASFQKLGDLLVYFRKDTGRAEFQLMACMQAMRPNAQSVPIEMAPAAALCAAM